jgi:predicted DNA-binding protein
MAVKSPTMLTLRLEPAQERALQSLAQHRGLSKSELVRELIASAVSNQHEDPRALVKSIIALREKIQPKKSINIRALIAEGRD